MHKIGLLAFGVFIFLFFSPQKIEAYEESRLWEVQSIDTMKYSRDLAREKLRDTSFDQVIETQITQIAQTGATHVSIGTPYDDEFLPFLKRWVEEARENNLNIWYRGNFSGWEEWFGYKPISRDEHSVKLKRFIENNADLFADGDIFSSCPECENGGPGDPRMTQDVKGFRNFLIDQHIIAKKSFEKLEKKVKTNYFSMNGDVAKLIMDKETTTKLEGIIVVDHYVKTPQGLNEDITEYAMLSGGKVVLGEFGAPIPDIHGNMSDSEQKDWMETALRLLSENPSLIGLNYWTSYGGSSAIWNNDTTPRMTVDLISSYYKPKKLEGILLNELGNPIQNANVIGGKVVSKTDNQGNFALVIAPHQKSLTIEAEGYEKALYIIEKDTPPKPVLAKEDESFFFWLAKKIKQILSV